MSINMCVHVYDLVRANASRRCMAAQPLIAAVVGREAHVHKHVLAKPHDVGRVENWFLCVCHVCV